MKVKVYFNLHNHKWSIKSNGKVLGHADQVTMINVKPSVSQAGRQRVLAEKRKNVHAYLVGDLVGTSEFTPFRGRDISQSAKKNMAFFAQDEITYNPYKYDRFVQKDTGIGIEFAGGVELKKDRRVFATNLVLQG
jgi:hypothetical protein